VNSQTFALLTAAAVICVIAVLAFVGWLQRQEADQIQRDKEQADADYQRRCRINRAKPYPLRSEWPSADAMPVQLFDQPTHTEGMK
jgi:hypothetical protein